MQIWLFDIDGTLIDSNGAGRAAMAGAVARQFGAAPETHGVAFSGRTDQKIARELFRSCGVSCSAKQIDEFHAHYLDLLPDSLKMAGGSVLPGVDQLLDAISQTPVAELGLITGNMRRGAELKLRHFDLEHFFCFGGFGDHHTERNKVAFDAARSAEISLGIDIEQHEVWVVGDTPHDITCARHINAKVIAVATGQHSPDELREYEPDLLLADLSDITPVQALLQNSL